MIKFLIPIGALLLFSVKDSTSQFSTCFEDVNPQTQNSNKFDFSGIDKMAMPLLRNLSALYTASPNLLVSPFSIWSVLTLALLGAKGNTKLELERALGLPSSKLQTFRTKTVLDFVITGSGLANPEGPEMRTMDRAYVDQSLSLRECVRKVIFKIDVVNFSDAVTTSDRINRDVSQATAGEIKDLLNPSHVVNAVFVLVNAIYFKGRWATEFDPLNTVDSTFTATNIDGRVEEVRVPTMVRQGNMNIARSQVMNADVLELPYKESTISMYIILPVDKNVKIEDTLSNLTPFSFSDVRNAMKELPVTLRLPKFDLKSKLEAELKETLNIMGIRDMFSRTNSDFTDFSSEKLVMDAIVHEARVRVDEEGTVAAAATSLTATRIKPPMFDANRSFIFLIYDKNIRARVRVDEEGTVAAAATAAVATRSGNFRFFYNVDRPFMFLIYDKRTNVTLFAGIIKDPRV